MATFLTATSERPQPPRNSGASSPSRVEDAQFPGVDACDALPNGVVAADVMKAALQKSHDRYERRGETNSLSLGHEGGGEVGGSFVHKYGRPGSARKTRKTHRNHPHAIDAPSSWSRPASPDSRPRREAELRYVPKLPWLRGLGSGRGPRGPVAVRESKNAKKEGALRVRIAVLCVPGSNG